MLRLSLGVGGWGAGLTKNKHRSVASTEDVALMEFSTKKMAGKTGRITEIK